jgi:hypothetical protein
LQDGDVFFQCVRTPGVQQLVQKLGGLSADDVGLGLHVAGHDGNQAVGMHVLKSSKETKINFKKSKNKNEIQVRQIQAKIEK